MNVLLMSLLRLVLSDASNNNGSSSSDLPLSLENFGETALGNSPPSLSSFLSWICRFPMFMLSKREWSTLILNSLLIRWELGCNKILAQNGFSFVVNPRPRKHSKSRILIWNSEKRLNFVVFVWCVCFHFSTSSTCVSCVVYSPFKKLLRLSTDCLHTSADDNTFAWAS